ncbi:hypothetical protein [Frankia sp. Cas4]|uniref:hypothetical protein n=1 Tax=Frankia sp. Cas4 TaxID=3073927 RepID=UPI002AD58135|nr:hypothetical protein [Frankia sp. Cas4]
MAFTEYMRWDVRLLDEVEAWLLGLDDDSYDLVAAAIDKLADDRAALATALFHMPGRTPEQWTSPTQPTRMQRLSGSTACVTAFRSDIEFERS